MADNEYKLDDDTLNPDLRKGIKGLLERTVPRLIDDSGTNDYTWKAIVILLFNHIDLLGHLLSGDSSKANRAKWAVTFIRSYVGKVDEKYAMAGGFIYYMLGNGMVHESYPGTFNTDDGRMIKFEFTGTQVRQKHLSITQSDNELRLTFDITIFCKDLLNAIDLYCLDLNNDRALQENYRQALNGLTEPGDRSRINNHAYILASDIGFINDQLL